MVNEFAKKMGQIAKLCVCVCGGGTLEMVFRYLGWRKLDSYLNAHRDKSMPFALGNHRHVSFWNWEAMAL